jgi:hypothetical protein
MAKKRKRVERTDPNNEPPLKKQSSTTELPPGVHHYEQVEEVPWDIQKSEALVRICLPP